MPRNPRYAKAKGRDAENSVVEFLRRYGIPAERRRQTGMDDCGDISGFNGVVVEVKACKRLDFAGFLDELEAERANAAARFNAAQLGLVIAKRKGRTDPADWYAVMPPGLAVRALQALFEKDT